MSLALEEILSRLPIQGATASNTGGPYPYYLVVLNSAGQIDPSLFTSTLAYYSATSYAGLPSSPASGSIGVVNNTTIYIYTNAWQEITPIAAASVPYSNSGTPLVSTNLQTALTEVAERAVLVDTGGTITGPVTFNTGSTAPFSVGSGSASYVVNNLNAQYVGGANLASLQNASNLSSGTLNSARLSGTYAINISGQAATALVANSALNIQVSASSSATPPSNPVVTTAPAIYYQDNHNGPPIIYLWSVINQAWYVALSSS